MFNFHSANACRNFRQYSFIRKAVAIARIETANDPNNPSNKIHGFYENSYLSMKFQKKKT